MTPKGRYFYHLCICISGSSCRHLCHLAKKFMKIIKITVIRYFYAKVTVDALNDETANFKFVLANQVVQDSIPMILKR